MLVALISDIHGNALALEAALASIEADQPDHIVCLGDVAAFGPQPCQAIERLRALDFPTVMGNTDEWLLNPGVPTRPEDDRTRRLEDIGFWNVKQLTPADTAYLRTFRPTVRVALGDGGPSLLCYHGSPRNFHDIISPATPEDELEIMLKGFDDLVLAGGHTHDAMLRRYRGQILLNTGSIGLPIERLPAGDRNPPWAEYALVRWQDGRLGIELRRTPVDAGAVVQAALDSGMPHADWWAKDWG
jgi:predicted phosphodiesterase